MSELTGLVRRPRPVTHDRELGGFLVLGARGSVRILPRCAARRDEMGRVDLDAVVGLGAELGDRVARVVGELRGFDEAEADRDAGGVVDGVGAGLDGRRGVLSGGGLENEVERIVGVELQSAEFGRGVALGIRDRGQALSVAVDGEVHEVGRGEVERVPLEGDAGLGRVADPELGRGRLSGAKLLGDVVLEVPKVAGVLLLGGRVAGAGNVDDGAGTDAGGQEERRELDQVDRLRGTERGSVSSSYPSVRS